MTELLRGAEVVFALGCLAFGFGMVWIAKPTAGSLEPKFSFLRSETGQVVYTCLCLSVLAVGLSTAFHGLVNFSK